MHEITLLIVGAILGALASKTTEWLFDWYKDSRKQKSPILVKAEDIVAWGWDGKRLLKELIRLDKKVLGHELTSESREGTIDQWAPVFMRDTSGWAALAIQRKIIGYFSFFALNARSYEQAEKGQFFDSQVTLETTIPFETPGLYKGYFVLLGALPDYPVSGRRLLDAFFDEIKVLAERGVFFEEMLANAFTPHGVGICEGFGMERVCDHADFGVVYRLRLNPWPSCLDFKKWREIKALYEEKVIAKPQGTRND